MTHAHTAALPLPPVSRLWQLQSKMTAVGGEGTYEARLERVVQARAGIEQRLQVGQAAGVTACIACLHCEPAGCPGRPACMPAHSRTCTAPHQHHQQNRLPCPALPCPAPPQKRIELVDSYARVIAMIEIEVEMDSELPAAEVLGEWGRLPACLKPAAASRTALTAGLVLEHMHGWPPALACELPGQPLMLHVCLLPALTPRRCRH